MIQSSFGILFAEIAESTKSNDETFITEIPHVF